MLYDYANKYAFNDPLDVKADATFQDYLVDYQRNLFAIKDEYTIGHESLAAPTEKDSANFNG
ncbi:UNVERIFIED_CONTAM: hypothetical protein O8I53_13170 [Campylobacter lari]